MVKLIIQIPCKNEEATLPLVVRELPKHIDGIDSIEYQVIDDGSTDRTSQVAKELWIHHIIRFKKNKWLWSAFREWVNNALKLWADILVNTDADNQYPSRYIADLVQPILEHRADMVIGNRNPTKEEKFSPLKRFFQRFGNKVVSNMVGETLPDSVSGFRAYSKDALIELNVTSKFSYVIDTIIQAYKKWIHIEWVPITTNPVTRESRLFTSMWQHMKRSASTIIRVYIMYEPFKIWLRASVPFLLVGWIEILRFVYYYFTVTWTGKIQSLIISSLIMQVWFLLIILGLIADLTAKNRFLIEENMKTLKEMKYEKK